MPTRNKNERAMFNKAIRFLKINRTHANGIKILQKLAKRNYPDADLELAIEALNGKFRLTNELLIEILKKYSQSKNPIAMMNLGYCFDLGIGVKKNIKKAFNLYNQAAHMGLSQAQYNLALCFEKGNGCQKDFKEAFQWYKKAASQGHKEALNSVGYYYKYGLGVRKNYKQALKFFKKSAQKGFASAYSNIGSMYLSGFGVKESKVKAKKYLSKGAELGSQLGKTLLSEFE